jgi:hypothetical protein
MGASTLLFALAPGTPAQEGGPLDPVLEQVTPAQEGDNAAPAQRGRRTATPTTHLACQTIRWTWTVQTARAMVRHMSKDASK